MLVTARAQHLLGPALDDVRRVRWCMRSGCTCPLLRARHSSVPGLMPAARTQARTASSPTSRIRPCRQDFWRGKCLMRKGSRVQKPPNWAVVQT